MSNFELQLVAAPGPPGMHVSPFFFFSFPNRPIVPPARVYLHSVFMSVEFSFYFWLQYCMATFLVGGLCLVVVAFVLYVAMFWLSVFSLVFFLRISRDYGRHPRVSWTLTDERTC